MPLFAAAQHFTSGADFLLIGSGARSEGMGGAFTAVADDVNALTFNPAGLALLKVPEVGYLRMIYVADMAYNFGGVAVPFVLGENSLGLGAGIVNLGVPEFESTLGIATPISASDNAVLLSVAYRVKELVSFGLTGKYLFRSITGYNAAAIAGDFGVLATPVERLRLGAGVFNVGQSVKFASTAGPLPTQVKLGLSYEVVKIEQHSALASLEGAYLLQAQAGAGAAGAEYWYDGVLAARLGFAGDAYQQRWTAGVGVRLQMFQFDYSYSPVGTLGDSHRLSVLLRLGGGEGMPGLSTPSGFAADPFDGGILLKWKPASSKDVVGYHLYVKKPGTDAFARVTGNPLNDTSVRLKSLQNGKAYAFALTSVSAAGRESGQVKLSVVAGTGTLPVPLTPIAPSAPPGPPAPTGLKAETLGEGFRLSWDKAGGEIAGYNLYLAGDAEKPARIVSDRLITENRVDMKKVNPERLYRFYLTGVNKRGVESAPSAVLEVKPADFSKTTEPVFSDPVLVMPGEPAAAPAQSAPTRPPQVLPAPTAKPKVEAPEKMQSGPPEKQKAEGPAPAEPEKSAAGRDENPVLVFSGEPAKAEKPAAKITTPVPAKVEPTAPPAQQPQVMTIDKKWLAEGKVKKFTIRPGDGMVRLSWEAVPGAVGYHLYVSYDEKTFTLITKKGPQNILELNIRSLTNGKTYYFAVSAVNEALQESEKTMLPAVPKASP